MESITDTDYKHSKSACKGSWLQNLGRHHDMYLQIYTCLYLHLIPPCLKMYLKVSPGLMLKKCLKKIIVKIELLMVEKGIRSGICHAVHRWAKANKNIWHSIIRLKNYHTSFSEMSIINMDGQCHKKSL